MKPRLLFQPGYEGREVTKAAQAARTLGVPWDCGVTICDDHVPVGNVYFCERVWRHQTGLENPVPDFYPTWLASWMHRTSVKIDTTETDMINYFDHSMFVKRADAYKAEQAKLVRWFAEFPTGKLWVCSPVKFTQEWRYYVADGEVVATGWYDGDNEDEPAPDLGIDWPDGFCGAVDFGRLDTGEIALVECHHPYACGWYGDDHELYVLWLIEGWEWMKAEASKFANVC